MAEKKYLSLDKLQKYHGKLIETIDAKDAQVLSDAKSYANSLASNYDAAGSAATVQGNLDTEIARAKAAEQAASEAATTAQNEVDALERYVGTIPTSSTATDVVTFVVEKTTGIATSSALAEIQGDLDKAEAAIDAIEADYLKAADKAELAAAVAAEESRAKGVETGIDNRLKAVEADYLKAADKTELNATISEHKAILDAVKEDVDAFFLDADMTESAKDTLKELQTYIASDETGAAAMAESIQKNKDDIAGVAGRVGTLEGEMDAVEGKINTAGQAIAALEEAIGEGGDVATQISTAVKAEEDARKAAVAEVQGEVDAVEGRVDTLEGKMTTVEGAVATKAEQADLNAAVGRISTVEGKVTTLEGKMTTVEGKVSTLEGEMDAVEAKAAANEAAIAANVTAIGTKADQSALEAEIARAKAAEEANKALIESFVEISETEILALFA